MISIFIFSITYIFIAIGKVPYLNIDRTGIALIGAIAMVVSKSISPGECITAIDFPTIILLFGLMILSAQFKLSGLYNYIVQKSLNLTNKPRLFLLFIMILSGLLSAILTNDVICLSLTPLIIYMISNKSNLNPLPYLLGIAVSSNIGSTLTIIGNPQNILIAQMGKLHFFKFLLWSSIPVTASLLVSYFIIYYIYRNKLFIDNNNIHIGSSLKHEDINNFQCLKSVILTVVLIILFFTTIPKEVSVMIIAAIVILSKKITLNKIFNLINWKLLILFCSLFIVVKGFSIHGYDKDFLNMLEASGINLSNPIHLMITSGVMGNIFSNVPSTMLLLNLLPKLSNHMYYILAIATTFAGNFIIIGSIANIIVVEQSKKFNINISFFEYFKVGWIVTVASLLILIGWTLI